MPSLAKSGKQRQADFHLSYFGLRKQSNSGKNRNVTLSERASPNPYS
jgi:hypothetical protein